VYEPATIGQDGFYQTNPSGAVLWENTPGADRYEARLSQASDDCAENAVWTEVPQDFGSRFAEVYLGDTIAENLVLIRDPVKLFPQGELDLDENKNYHLYIRSIHGDQRGACGHFPVRKAMLKPFDMIGSLTPVGLPFKSGGPFAWQPSQGAVRYEIVLFRLGFDEVARETVDAAMLQPNAAGNLEYTLANKDALSIPNLLFWEVTSIHRLGFVRVANLNGVPHTAFDQTPSFFTAAEARFDATFDGGQVGPAVAGRIPVKIVRPRNMQDKVTTACFAKPANTLGMRYWWGGTSDLPVTPDEFVKVLPDPTTSDKLCTAALPLRDDSMFLFSQFFSNGSRRTFGFPSCGHHRPPVVRRLALAVRRCRRRLLRPHDLHRWRHLLVEEMRRLRRTGPRLL
jgi:hypothetical protein